MKKNRYIVIFTEFDLKNVLIIDADNTAQGMQKAEDILKSPDFYIFDIDALPDGWCYYI